MKPKKPDKEVYSKEIQDRIYDISRKFVSRVVKQNPKIYLVNVFGSVIKRNMGFYKGIYNKERYGSDVDIVCIVDPKFLAPKNWKLLVHGSCFDMYNFDAVENYIPELGKKDLPINPFKFLIYIPGVHNYEEAKELSAIDKEEAEKKGWPVETWHINKKGLARAMKEKK